MPPTDPIARALELIEAALGVCAHSQDVTLRSKPKRLIAHPSTANAALLLAKGLLSRGHSAAACYRGVCVCGLDKLAAEFIERVVGDGTRN